MTEITSDQFRFPKKDFASNSFDYKHKWHPKGCKIEIWSVASLKPQIYFHIHIRFETKISQKGVMHLLNLKINLGSDLKQKHKIIMMFVCPQMDPDYGIASRTMSGWQLPSVLLGTISRPIIFWGLSYIAFLL